MSDLSSSCPPASPSEPTTAEVIDPPAAVVPFDFEGATLRVLVRRGEPHFVASDVCRTLEIGNTSDALRRLDDDEKGVAPIDTPGGVQSMAFVTEGGLYSLILGSRKAQAKRFKRWVTHEVLPSIRRTGTYTAPGASRAPVDFRSALATREGMAQVLVEALEALGGERDRRETAERALLTARAETAAERAAREAAETKLDELDGAAALRERSKPAAEAHGFREAAKLLDVSPVLFVEFLTDGGFCHRLGRRKRLCANERYLRRSKPWFVVRCDEIPLDNGETVRSQRTSITAHGLEGLAGRFPKWLAAREARS